MSVPLVVAFYSEKQREATEQRFQENHPCHKRLSRIQSEYLEIFSSLGRGLNDDGIPLSEEFGRGIDHVVAT